MPQIYLTTHLGSKIGYVGYVGRKIKHGCGQAKVEDDRKQFIGWLRAAYGNKNFWRSPEAEITLSLLSLLPLENAYLLIIQ